MLFQQVQHEIGRKVGHEAEINFGERVIRQNSFRSFANVAGVQTANRAGRLVQVFFQQLNSGQVAKERRDAQIGFDLCLVVRNRRKRIHLRLGRRADVLLVIVNQNSVVRVLQRGKRPGQAPRRVDDGRRHRRVQIAFRAARVQFDVDDALDAARHVRAIIHILVAGFPQTTVHVLQQRAIFLRELRQVNTADLFFTLKHKFDFERQRSVRGKVRFNRLDAAHQVALVVRNAARKQFAVADRRFPGSRLPQVERLGRLHIVMVVEHERARAATDFAVNDRRAARDWNEPRLRAQFLQTREHQLRRFLHPPVLRGNTGLATQGLQFRNEPVAVCVDVLLKQIHLTS